MDQTTPTHRSSRDDPTQSPAPHPAGFWRREHLTRPLRLADLTDDLLWPRLLRAAPLAMRPARVVIAFFTLLAISLIWRVPGYLPKIGGDAFLSDAAAALRSAADTGQLARTDGLLNGVGAFFSTFLFGVPASLLMSHPVWTIVLTLLTLPILAMGGGAISRLVACEFSQCVMIPWTEALGLVLRRKTSLIGAALSPLVIAGGTLLSISVGGWLLLNWPGVNLLGATLYPLFIAGGFVVSIILIGYLLGQCLLTPAVVCENTDAIDAMQRAYAYVIASPLRLLLYSAVLVAQLVAVAGMLGLIVGAALQVASAASTAFTGTEAAVMVHGGAPEGSTWSAGASLISFWTAIPTALISAFMLSFYFSGSTILYMLLRRLNDGQDPAEIWMPGLVPGTLASTTAQEHSGPND